MSSQTQPDRLPGEQLKRIPGFPQYFISDYGRVLNAKTKRVVHTLYGTRKHKKKVALRRDGKEHIFYVHRLVAQAFMPDYDADYTIEHIDNPIDNWIGNLSKGKKIERNKRAQASPEVNESEQKDDPVRLPDLYLRGLVSTKRDPEDAPEAEGSV